MDMSLKCPEYLQTFRSQKGPGPPPTFFQGEKTRCKLLIWLVPETGVEPVRAGKPEGF